MTKQHLKHLAELNIATIFISTSGVLGRYISLPPALTIWWRCLLAALFIGVFVWYKGYSFKVSAKKDVKYLLFSGALLGAHWVTYFYALHLSNVAIGLLSLFTYPVITALLEPIFFKIKLNKMHVVLGGIVLLGIYFLTPEFNLENNYTLGVLMGLISSFFYALRNILTKKHLQHINASKVMFYQMISVVLLMLPVLQIYTITPSLDQWMALGTLALVTTAIGHTLFVNSFKHFSIGTVSIMSSIQPIYGILFAMLFLNEIPASKTIIGGMLILSTVVIESIQSGRKK